MFESLKTVLSDYSEQIINLRQNFAERYLAQNFGYVILNTFRMLGWRNR